MKSLCYLAHGKNLLNAHYTIRVRWRYFYLPDIHEEMKETILILQSHFPTSQEVRIEQ